METTIDLDPLCFGVLQRVPKKEESRRTGAANPKNQCECLTRKKCLSHVQETREREREMENKSRDIALGDFDARARPLQCVRVCVRWREKETELSDGRTDGEL